MYEIEKLRKRLSNASKSTIEYRMTIVEARALILEIDDIIAKSRIIEKVPEPVEEGIGIRILDGGTL
jgi:hypothetical protein